MDFRNLSELPILVTFVVYIFWDVNKFLKNNCKRGNSSVEQGEQLIYLANYWAEALKEIFAFKYYMSYSFQVFIDDQIPNYQAPLEIEKVDTNLNQNNLKSLHDLFLY